MAGKRLLDAAALFTAGRAVFRKHIALRSQQWDVYSKTSSLTRLVKQQGDIAAGLTAQEAPYSSRHSDRTIPSVIQDQPRQGQAQDHFYKRSQDSGAVKAVSEEGLGVKQEGGLSKALPDEKVPTTNTAHEDAGQDQSYTASTGRGPAHREVPMSADEARRAQRQSEFQIPSRTADQESNEQSDVDATRLSKDQDEDVFYVRAEKAASVLSELPRAKIPKHTEDSQGVGGDIRQAGINSDVFSPSSGSQDMKVLPETQAVPDQEQIPEGINTDVFHSPKISRLLGLGEKSPSLGLKGASGTPLEKTELAKGKDQDTFNVRMTEQSHPTAPETSAAEGDKRGSKDGGESDSQNPAAGVLRDLRDATSAPEASCGGDEMFWVAAVLIC